VPGLLELSKEERIKVEDAFQIEATFFGGAAKYDMNMAN